MDVLALQILNALCLDCLRIRQLHDSDWKAGEFRKSGGSQATCSGDNFVLPSFQFPYQKRCQNTLRLEAGWLLCRWSFCGGGRQTARGNGRFTFQKGT